MFENSNIKVCHITPFYGEQCSGPERYVDTLTAHQRDTGLDVTILSTTQFKNGVGKSISNGIKRVKIFSFKNIWQINPVSFIIPYLRKFNFDIIHVHSHLYFISNQAILFGKIKKAHTLLHLHGGIGLPPYNTSNLKLTAKAFYDKTLGHLTVSNAELIASVSKKDIQRVKSSYNIPKKKMIHLPNAINYKSFANNPYSSHNDINGFFPILYIGDIEPWKGIEFLEKWIISRRLHYKNKLKFQFVGQGSLAPRLKALANLCKDSNIIVEYLGPRPHAEIPKLLSRTRVLILPSYWEGMPTVILEAMAAKIPVIATPVGDIPNIIKNRKNGILINHNFSSLEKALEFLINNPSEAKILGKEGFKTAVNSFSSEIIHKNVLKAYLNLINSK